MFLIIIMYKSFLLLSIYIIVAVVIVGAINEIIWWLQISFFRGRRKKFNCVGKNSWFMGKWSILSLDDSLAWFISTAHTRFQPSNAETFLDSETQPIEIEESCVSMCVTTYECIIHSISFICILLCMLLIHDAVTVLSALWLTNFCKIKSAVLLYTHVEGFWYLCMYKCCCVCESYTRFVHAHFFSTFGILSFLLSCYV